MPILESLAAGAAGAAVNNGIQRMFSADEQRNYAKNQKANYRYSQEAQRNSARNMVEGFQMAGLSPALAAGANFTAAPMASAPLQNKAAIPMDVSSMLRAGKELELLDAQKSALSAQASQMSAEADKTKIESGRMTAEDVESKDAMLNAITRLESQFGRDIGLDGLKNYLESPDTPWNTGSVSAWLRSMDFERALSSNLVGDVSDALDEMIAKGKISENVVEDIKKMSHLERRMLERQIDMAVKQMALISAQTENTKSQTPVNERMVEKLKAEIQKLGKEKEYVEQETKRSKANTDATKNADFRTKYLTGDFNGTAAVFGLDGLHSLLNLLGLLKRR